MGKPLSIDLRSRLVAAVASGASRRAAAKRFGISAASAVRWVQAVSTAGTVEAKPQGGDTRSHRIEASSSVILAAVAAQKDINLVDLADLLRTEHGASFGGPSGFREGHGLGGGEWDLVGRFDRQAVDTLNNWPPPGGKFCIFNAV
jgi:transposase